MSPFPELLLQYKKEVDSGGIPGTVYDKVCSPSRILSRTDLLSSLPQMKLWLTFPLEPLCVSHVPCTDIYKG